MMEQKRIARIFSLLLAVSMLSLSFAGCVRNVQQEETIPDTIEGLSGGGEENFPGNDREKDAEQEQNFPENKEKDSSGSSSAGSSGQSQEQSSGEQSQKKDEQSSEKQSQERKDPLSGKADAKELEEEVQEPAAEETAQTASAQGLDTKKLGWGPGGPVDENNRPDGACVYQEKYGKYDADFIKANEKNIYLTFDEGYENGYTDDILDVLKEKEVPAVFFVTQPYVKSEPELVQRMIDEGHIVGNHTVNHPSMPDTSTEQCRQEVLGLHEYMKENFNYEMKLFRFPMGEFSELDLSILQQLGYRSVFWSFAYRDWLVDDQPNPQEALRTIESRCHPGAIYLLHAVSKTNTEILGQMIDDLRMQGYTFCSYE